jgi:hypothetical protein
VKVCADIKHEVEHRQEVGLCCFLPNSRLYFIAFSFLGVEGILGGASVAFVTVLLGDSGDSGKLPPRPLSYSYQTPLILLFNFRGGGLILDAMELHMWQGCVD